MEYLKLQRGFRESDAWMAADVAARGAWTSVAGFCADEENAGRIVGARAWNDRLWLLRAGCSAAEVEHAVGAKLAAWDGDDLVVAGYDLIGEQHYQARRGTARAGGMASGRSRSAKTRQRFQGSTGHEGHAQPRAEAHASTENEAHGEAYEEPPAEAEVEPSIHSPVTTDQDHDDHRAHVRDPRLEVVVAAGASLVSPDNDRHDLTPRWLAVFGDATPDEVRAVVQAAPRTLGYELKYPGKFQQVLKRVREAADGQRKAAAAEASKEKRLEDVERAKLIYDACAAFFATPEGAKLLARFSSTDRDSYEVLQYGQPDALYGFIQLTRKYPELAEVAGAACRAAGAA
jgi:hypothetical protein